MRNHVIYKKIGRNIISPTTSVFDHSSFQKEENRDTTDFGIIPNGDRADFLVNLYPREREPRILIDQCRIFVTLI